MPSNMLYVDTGFPTFNGTETTEAKIAALQNYMYMLLEQLRYSMRNMSPVNFNADGLKQMGTILTEPLEVRLGNAEGQMADFRVDLNGLDMRVGSVEQGLTDFRVTIEGVSSTVTDLSGRMTNAEQTADGFRRNITDLTGRMTTVEETAGGLTTTVKDLSGRMTTSEETAEGFRRDITGLDGRWSKIEETVNGVTYLGPDGRVMINNGSINLTGTITWGDLDSNVQGNINNRGVSESRVHTLITQDLVAAPTIAGGKFYELDLSTGKMGDTWLEIGSNGTGWGGMILKNTEFYGKNNALFTIFNGDANSGSFSWKGTSFLTFYNVDGHPQPRGTWDFSNATVTGLTIA